MFTAVDRGKFRVQNVLALGVTTISLIGVVVLGTFAIHTSSDKENQRLETTKTVLLAVLPLMGSWVGTVLAYYFSKENQESTAETLATFSNRLSERQILESVPVKNAMIPKGRMFFKVQPESDIKLYELLAELEKSKKGFRVPVLSEKGSPVLVVHRSVIDHFIAAQALNGKSEQDIKQLTMQDLLDDEELGVNLKKTSFGVVPASATLAEAKDAMESKTDCLDVFVTATGLPDEPLIGWLTNVTILENSSAISPVDPRRFNG